MATNTMQTAYDRGRTLLRCGYRLTEVQDVLAQEFELDEFQQSDDIFVT